MIDMFQGAILSGQSWREYDISAIAGPEQDPALQGTLLHLSEWLLSGDEQWLMQMLRASKQNVHLGVQLFVRWHHHHHHH